MGTHISTFEEDLYRALAFARDRSLPTGIRSAGSREKALVVTKLEEACLWNDADRVNRGLEPLGLHWRPL